MSETVPSYATIGLRLWAASKAPHGPGHDCLICADTRAYLDEPRVPSIPAPKQRMERSA